MDLCKTMKWFKSKKSRRVVQDSSMVNPTVHGDSENVNDLKKDLGQHDCWCWGNLPQELLREVFMKIEQSEPTWPGRKDVVACGGVCRDWREAMIEVVKTVEVTGKITFPISVKQPGPRESTVQCFIKRDRSTQSFHLYFSLSQALDDNGKFLLAARKFSRPMLNDYVIFRHADTESKGIGTYIGKLRSNFMGTKFVIYDALPPHAGTRMSKTGSSSMMVGSKQICAKTGNYPVGHITYELNVLGSRGPRKMHCEMSTIPASAVTPGGVAFTPIDFPIKTAESFPTIPFFWLNKVPRGRLNGQGDAALVLKNKSPRWHRQLHCWCLNFHGRVTVASVKNFQLVAALEHGVAGPENEKVILQFGKVGKDVFTMDYRYPLSAFQAFAICLSSFDTKIACE